MSQARQSVLVGDNFALLGDAYAALQNTVRLAEDRGMGRTPHLCRSNRHGRETP